MSRVSVVAALSSLTLLTAPLAQCALADGGDGARVWRVIRLIERAQDFTVQDLDPPGPSLGDRLVFTSNLFDEQGRAVGRADCVTVRLDPTAPPAEQQI